MLRILFRILMILLAAGFIAGGLYLYATNYTSNLSDFPGGREGFTSSQFDVPMNEELSEPLSEDKSLTNWGGGPGGSDEGDLIEGSFTKDSMERGREGGSLRSWLGVLSQAGKIVLITIIVAVIRAIVKAIRSRHHPTPTQPNTALTQG